MMTSARVNHTDSKNANTAAVHRHHLFDLATLFLVISGGVTMSLIGFKILRASEAENARVQFEGDAGDLVSAIERSLGEKILVVESLHSFYQASEVVTREGFAEYVVPFLESVPGIQALEWIPRVENSDRNQYEKDAKSQGYTEFQITERASQGEMIPATTRSEYYPVYFVEPMESNETAFGYDLGSNTTRLAALKKSASTGQMVATARITLVQEVEGEYGFLMFHPLYEGGKPITGGDNLSGFVLGVFRIGDIVRQAVGSLQSLKIAIEVEDTDADDAEAHLFAYRPEGKSDSLSVDSAGSVLEPFSEELIVGGRRWLIRCQPLTSYTHDFLSLYPHFAFLGSLILTSIVASYLVSTRKRTARIAILVNERTRELRASQEKYRLLAEENEILSLRDALTEILNRRGLDEKLEEECARSMRAKSSLACILIDIDHFKMYNDNYGHQKGDECLRETAQILNSCMLRAGDFVSRYGGEEFCIILPNINLEGAAVVAQRLQDAMARAEIPHLYSDVADRITLSMGLEAFVPSHDLASDQLIEHADKALYAAKRSGRNRFVSYSSSIAKVT